MHERLFVFLFLASAILVGTAFFLPVEYKMGFEHTEQELHEAPDSAISTAHLVRYERSFSDAPTWVDILVFSLPIVLALVQIFFRGNGALIVSAVSPLVLLALLGILGFRVVFFDFDLFSSRAPEGSYGGLWALVAMATSFLLSLLVLAAKLKNRRVAS